MADLKPTKIDGFLLVENSGKVYLSDNSYITYDSTNKEFLFYVNDKKVAALNKNGEFYSLEIEERTGS